MNTSALFRFDRTAHEYLDPTTGVIFPHITGMLEATGHIDTEWYTDEGRDRGTAVHDMTAEYDLGALDVASCVSPYRAYLLAHVQAMQMIRPTWDQVEEPIVHPTFLFGGRPDRVGTFDGRRAVAEVKSGAREDSHAIQTALQAILVAPSLGLPAHAIARFGLYYSGDGKFKVWEFVKRTDFNEAMKIIKETCR